MSCVKAKSQFGLLTILIIALFSPFISPAQASPNFSTKCSTKILSPQGTCIPIPDPKIKNSKSWIDTLNGTSTLQVKRNLAAASLAIITYAQGKNGEHDGPLLRKDRSSAYSYLEQALGFLNEDKDPNKALCYRNVSLLLLNLEATAKANLSWYRKFLAIMDVFNAIDATTPSDFYANGVQFVLSKTGVTWTIDTPWNLIGQNGQRVEIIAFANVIFSAANVTCEFNLK